MSQKSSCGAPAVVGGDSDTVPRREQAALGTWSLSMESSQWSTLPARLESHRLQVDGPAFVVRVRHVHKLSDLELLKKLFAWSRRTGRIAHFRVDMPANTELPGACVIEISEFEDRVKARYRPIFCTQARTSAPEAQLPPLLLALFVVCLDRLTTARSLTD